MLAFYGVCFMLDAPGYVPTILAKMKTPRKSETFLCCFPYSQHLNYLQ